MTFRFCMLAVRLLTAGPLIVGVDAFSGVDSPDAVRGGVLTRFVLIPLVQLLFGLSW